MFGGRRNKSFFGGDPAAAAAAASLGDDRKNNKSTSFHALSPSQDGASNDDSNNNNHNHNNNHNVKDDNDDNNDDEQISALTEMNPAELIETISHLKRSVMTHANSSAETMEHFSTLQKAHDALYQEHVHLQEQMDDAVELLKYLKEEKGNYELRIDELNREAEEMREAKEGDVVSLTIENLSKTKMELERTLEACRGKGDEALAKVEALNRENTELSAKLSTLEKVKEAYDLQTRQQLNAKAKLAESESVRLELENEVKRLERANAEGEERSKRGKDEYERRHEDTVRRMEEERSSMEKLRGINSNLKSERSEIQKELDAVREKARQDLESREYEMKVLNTKLSNSLSHVAQLQREKREIPPVTKEKEEEESKKSTTETKEKLEEMTRRCQTLEAANEDLLQEKKDMGMYVEKMEETLVEKDEALESTRAELDDRKEETSRKYLASLQRERENAELTERLKSLREEAQETEKLHQRQVALIQRQMEEQLESEFEREKVEMSNQIVELANQLKTVQEEAEEREEHHEAEMKTMRRETEEEQQFRRREREEQFQEAASPGAVELEEKLEGEREAHRRILRQMEIQLEERQRELERERAASAARGMGGGGGGGGPTAAPTEMGGDDDDDDDANPNQFSAKDSGHNELLLENESLKYKVQGLQDQLEEQSNTVTQRGEIHAQLEKEMQERLAKRIAVQLHEQKITMEAQIRGELEEEYNNNGRRLHDQDSVQSLPNNSAAVNELEEQLRIQLMQVKEERERWKREQEEIQQKVLNSQAQFGKVREGFKKKIDKEKARTRDLEKARQDQQIVIDRLSGEYQSVMAQFEELQEQIVSQKESSDQQSRQHWEDEKATLLQQYHQIQLEQMSQREEQYATQIRDLQGEINDLLNEQTAHEKEYDAWEDEKDSLLDRYNEKADELQRAVDDMDQMNSENAEYLKKMEDFENQMEELREELIEAEESKVKFNVLKIEKSELEQDCNKREEQNENLMRQMEQLNSENGDLQQQILSLEQKVSDASNDLSSTQDERNKLQDSLQETSQLCLELESKLSSYKRENEELAEDYDNKVDHLEELLDQAETASASVQLAVAAEKERGAAVAADLESSHQEIVAGMQKQVTDSHAQVSKLIDQLASASSEKARAESDLSTMKEESEAVAKKVAQLEDSVESLTVERDAAYARVAELLSSCESTERELSSLTTNADESKKTIDRLLVEKKDVIESLGAERDAANAQVEVLLSNYEGAEKALSSATLDVDKSKLTIDRITAEKENAIKSLSAERDAVNLQVAQVSSKCDQAEKALATASSDADESKLTIQRLTSEKREAIESLTAERDAANARVAELLSSYERLEKAVSSSADENKLALHHLASEKREAIESLTAERDAANARVTELLSSYERLEKAVSSNADENKLALHHLTSEKREAIESLTAERDAANARVTELLSSHEMAERAASSNADESSVAMHLVMADMRGSIESLTAERDAANAQLTELETKYESTKQALYRISAEKIDDIEPLTAERDAANARATDLQTKYESMEQALSSMSTNFYESQETIDRLTSEKRDEIESLSAERDAATARVTELLLKYESSEQALSSLTSTADESQATIARILEEKRVAIESLSAELDAANTRISQLLSSYESTEQAMSSLTSRADENKITIDRLTAEKSDTIARANALEISVKELQFELRVSTCEVTNLKTELKMAKQQQMESENKAQERSGANSNIAPDEGQDEEKLQNNSINENCNDYEEKTRVLQSKVDGLKESNTQLAKENIAMQARLASASSQNSEASLNKKLMKDLVEVNDNVQKLNTELRDTKDNNTVLEEAILDIQVEKEDLQLENEELASKLTDLTTQAKKMLLNNESLEEAIADQQIEYEDRIAELESELSEKCEDEDLRQKHKSALETIVKLKKELETGQEKNEATAVDGLKNAEEENSKLRQTIEHLSSENDAAKEIKFIVLELRAKNMDLTETLRVAEAANTAAADIIESLKLENDMLRKNTTAQNRDKSPARVFTTRAHDGSLVPFEGGTDNSTKISDTETELKTHYRSIVSHMKDGNSLSLADLTDTSEPAQRGPSDTESRNLLPAQSNKGALVTLKNYESRDHLNNAAINQGTMIPKTDETEASSFSPALTQLHYPTEVDYQIKNLTIENGQLAQRLGGAVAEKEFAMTTLTKLGAKMEELIERNKYLTNMADMKGQHPSRGASIYPGEEDVNNRQVLRLENKGRDPDATNQEQSYSAYTEKEEPSIPTSVRHHDDNSTPQRYHDDGFSEMSSTIYSYQQPKQLEPESASTIANRGGGDFLKNRTSGGEGSDQQVSDLEPESASTIANRGGGEFLKSRASGDVEGYDQQITDRHEALSLVEEESLQTGPKLVMVPGGEYFGQLNEKNQKHGNGKMKYDNGNEYDGQWKNNKRDGKGITKYASGNIYTGTWKTGKRHGFGVFHIKKTGDVYRGNWALGLKSGPGVYEYADGELDVSYYEEDVRVGEGVRWSASREQASRLVDGQLVGEEGAMPVEDAMKLTKELGFVV